MVAYRLIGLLALASQGFRLLAPCYCSSHVEGRQTIAAVSHGCCGPDARATASLRGQCCCDERESGDHPAVSAPDFPKTHVAHPVVPVAPGAPPVLEPVAEAAPVRPSLPDVLLAGFTPDLRGPPC